MKFKEKHKLSLLPLLFLTLVPAISSLSNVSKIKLQVCSCLSANNSDCNQRNISVPVLIPGKDDYKLINVNDFNVTFNVSLRCEPKKIPIIVGRDDFYLFSTGQLIHISTGDIFKKSNQFCIQPYGKEWEINICLKPPRIPMCCTSPDLCPVPRLPIMFGASKLLTPAIDTKSSCSSHQYSNGTIGNHSYILYETYSSIFADSLVTKNFHHYRYHSAEEYCLKPFIKEGNIAYNITLCIPNSTERAQLCKDSTCIHKCCPLGEIFNSNTSTCQESAVEFHWRPSLKKISNPKTAAEIPNNLRVMSYPLKCRRESYQIFTTDKKYGFVILENGSLYTPSLNQTTLPSHYCVDNAISHGAFTQEYALICFPDDPPKIDSCIKIKNTVVPILLIISCVFLAITLFVYGFIPELHAKLHGKSLLSHVTALLLAYTFLAILRLASSKLPMHFCVGIGLTTQFSFLAAFFWLNIMCFDIWWTLRSMRPVTEANDSTRRRFLLYSTYAWGLPALIMGATLATILLPEEKFPDIIRPGFGKFGCFFPNDLRKWIYLYSFISVLTIANIFFFICVTIILVQAQRANNSILRTPNLHHKERIWVYLKLFVVMGITWICEVISFQGSCEYWLITDVINSLQGLFIFLIFICKRSVYHKLPCNRKAPLGRSKRNQGTCSYGSSSLSTQQTSMESSR